MKKTSVYLPESLKDRLALLARRTGRSEAQLLRLAVERLVADEPSGRQPVAQPGVGVGSARPGPGRPWSKRVTHRVREVGAELPGGSDIPASDTPPVGAGPPRPPAPPSRDHPWGNLAVP